MAALIQFLPIVLGDDDDTPGPPPDPQTVMFWIAAAVLAVGTLLLAWSLYRVVVRRLRKKWLRAVGKVVDHYDPGGSDPCIPVVTFKDAGGDVREVMIHQGQNTHVNTKVGEAVWVRYSARDPTRAELEATAGVEWGCLGAQFFFAGMLLALGGMLLLAATLAVGGRPH